jgi:hypothetical protein
MYSLRKFALVGALSVALSAAPSCVLNAQTATPPPANMLESGDLLWPKKKDAIVPYNSKPGQAGDQDAENWEKERDQYLASIRSKPDVTEQEKERYLILKNMSYPAFLGLYLDNEPLGGYSNFGNGPVSVGHVGIVQIVEGHPTVVEAMIGPGVRRISYSDWLKQRSDELIWLGRLKDVSPGKRAAAAKFAASMIGKPYRFFNFNLSDDSGFYCSKLAWLSIFKGAGFAPDGDENPARLLWYSPKQLMYSERILLLVNPGNYGTK